jgi:hypothetical protein
VKTKTIKQIATEILVEYGLAKGKAVELASRIEAEAPGTPNSPRALEMIAKIAHAELVDIAAGKREQNSSVPAAAATLPKAATPPKKKAPAKKKAAPAKKAAKKKAPAKKKAAKKKAPAKKKAAKKKATKKKAPAKKGASSKFTDDAREKQALARRVWWARQRIEKGTERDGDKALVKQADAEAKAAEKAGKAEKKRTAVTTEQLARAS